MVGSSPFIRKSNKLGRPRLFGTRGSVAGGARATRFFPFKELDGPFSIGASSGLTGVDADALAVELSPSASPFGPDPDSGSESSTSPPPLARLAINFLNSTGISLIALGLLLDAGTFPRRVLYIRLGT